MDSMTWLPIAWFAVISFGVLMYVVLDGFVLGIGILAPFAEDEEQLDVMMNTAAPIWDGSRNLAGARRSRLLTAFPTAYAALLSALYLPVLLLLVSLVFRGSPLSSGSKPIAPRGFGRGFRPWLASGRVLSRSDSWHGGARRANDW